MSSFAYNINKQHDATPMQYSARQLAAILNVQPSTITRDIKKGRVSSAKDEKGGYLIDASEIVRAYPDRVTVDDAGNIAAKGQKQQEATPPATDATAVLEVRLAAAERLLAEREGTVDDLRQRLDAEAEERRKLTALLTDQSAKTEPLPPTPTVQGWGARLRFLATGKA
jgi:hypothetical protein